jgi:hypothetical protein
MMFRPAQKVRLVNEGDWPVIVIMTVLLVGLAIFLIFAGVDWVIAGYRAKATCQHLGWSFLITAITGWLVSQIVFRLIRAVAGPRRNS